MVHIDPKLAPSLPGSSREAILVAEGGGARRKRDPRYTRFVTTMKVTLPAVAALLLGAVLIWPQIVGRDERFRVGFSGLSAKEVDALTMVNARYFGTDNNNQPFAVTADSASEVAKGVMAVELESPKADLTAGDGTWLALSADTGVYSQPSQMLDLMGNVNLYHDKGYELHTASARADLKEGRASGDDPVKGQGPFGVLESQGFRLYDRGARIVFTGKSKLVLHPGADPSKR
ncbi:MAG: LPS export ABC transporter periplasmic protein LptC [Rhodospirillales bacterium]|nr:LPS export ABC transporter periplasmic protein LptC [Rhodospirillales bacterium]